MALPSFAWLSDLEKVLGRSLGSPEAELQAERMLATASARIRVAAGHQQVSLVEDDVVRLAVDPCEYVLRLPQRPVIEVTSIGGLTTSQWSFDGIHAVRRLDGWWRCRSVEVTYSHGYAEIPDLVVGICLDMVKRVLDNPTAARSHATTIGQFSESTTYGGNGDLLGQVILTDQEKTDLAAMFGTNLGTMRIFG